MILIKLKGQQVWTENLGDEMPKKQYMYNFSTS